jgi:hypothetical protein
MDASATFELFTPRAASAAVSVTDQAFIWKEFRAILEMAF